MSRPYQVLLLILFAMVTGGRVSAQDPYERQDGTWISLAGSVDTVNADSFMLDYPGGSITVEMDDGDRDAEGYKLIEGDRVTVYGMVDNDFFEARKIEASSVYVEKIGTFFYASAVDEEDDFLHTVEAADSDVALQGTVTSVGDGEFTLDQGARRITIDVDEMVYNPLDDEGYQKIQKGDRVNVTGKLDHEFQEGRVVDAETVVTLRTGNQSG